MRVIGTAGHVDHGKSTLIQALTGTHPDRLKEEQEREMTIDLGFAWWHLPNGEEIGVVDVPGHRDFIENMLAGVGGIDAALFVVAADEGVMPQTREHLAILDILQIKSGVVALTKIDLVLENDWLDLVEDDLRAVFDGTVLAEVEIVRVSAKTGAGLEDLQAALTRVLAETPPRPDLGRPRLPVDRVFTIAGFGTVVTGTLIDGVFAVGDEVVLLPGEQSGRIRGLQTHKRKQDTAQPGSRTAINISGVNLDQALRGQIVTWPGLFTATRRLDVHFRLLPDASQPVKHDMEVKFFVGASEVIGRVRLLGVQVLQPGEQGWLQLELREPVVAARGDRYILRRPSPGETIGGGRVLDPHPKGRHRRFSEAVLARLEALTQGSPEEVFMQALLTLGVAKYAQVWPQANLEEQAAAQVVAAVLESGDALVLVGDPTKVAADTMLTSHQYWAGLQTRLLAVVQSYHADQPLRRGMPREELKSRLKLETAVFNAAITRLVGQEILAEQGPLVLSPGYEIKFSPAQQQQADGLLARFAQTAYTPPTVKDCLAAVDENVYQALIDLGELLPLSSEVVFRTADYEQAVADVRGLIAEHGSITLAQGRDHWGTSRRYVQALLEYMDGQSITMRQGDGRILRPKR